MLHLDEGTIHAWLDGALSPEEAARVEAHVGSCSMCADATAEARGLIAASSRILTALDNVPNIRGAGGARGAAGAGRRSLSTWLVREKIAAVVTLVVAGGALALVMSRDTQRAAEADLASEPIRTVEIAVALPPAAPEEAMNLESERPPAAVRVTPPPASPRGVATSRTPEPPPTASVGEAVPKLMVEAAPVFGARTDDSLRSVTVAQAQRAEARDASTEAGASLAGKVGAARERRRLADAPARLSETQPTAQAFGAAAGAGSGSGAPRLVQEEKMIEAGQEVRRRIYSVDGILVTLDERSTNLLELEQRRSAANAPSPSSDSAAVSTTIQWIDATGKEFTLTGVASTERLERIRKLLGL